jgi:hypothetical protein
MQVWFSLAAIGRRTGAVRLFHREDFERAAERRKKQRKDLLFGDARKGWLLATYTKLTYTDVQSLLTQWREMMGTEAIILTIQSVILGITGEIVWWYTKETNVCGKRLSDKV